MSVHTIHEAKTQLSKLIEKASKGEVVIIARGKKPVAKLVPIESVTVERKPGRFAGQIWWTPDAFDPLTDEEMRELGFE